MAASSQQTPPFPPPQDQDLKNIIDKLANFVARNGTKFEEMTKSKQKDNPKFSFLFGGEYFNYYKWKVSVEVAQSKPVPHQSQPQFSNSQAANVQQAIVQQSIQSAPWQQPQQQTSNTSTQQQSQEQPYLSQSDFNFKEFETYLVKIMQSCTKDHISNGKNWIFKNCKTHDHFKQVADYMLARVTGKGMGFLHKLHIIYLINDVLHHSTRKSTPDVKPVFQDVIVPIYCCTFVGESPENQQRLGKVIRIWETNNYFSSDIIEKMKNAGKDQPESSNDQDYTQSDNDYEHYDQYTSYHQETTDDQVKDAVSEPQGTAPEEKQQSQDAPDKEPNETGPEVVNAIPSTADQTPAEKQVINQFESQPPPHQENMPYHQIPQHPHPDQIYPYPHGNFPYDHPPDFHQFPPPGFPRPPFNQPPPRFNGPMPPFDPGFVPRPPPPSMGYPHCPPQRFDYNHGFSDHPPSAVHDYHHGQPGMPVMEEPPRAPQAMYYELPAGLMVPLVTPKDVDYQPINQVDIQLPPPQPPSERLVNAVEAFYAPPSHERPRNSEGWEAGALHEFYKIKLPFIKEREVRDKIEKVKEMAMKKTETTTEDQKRSRSRSRSKSRGRSKSLSPKRRSRSRSPRRRSRSTSRGRSPRRRRSKSRTRSRSRSPRRRRSGSRERTSPPIRRRSPTPPTFAGAYLQQSLNTRIDETNVGHKLLKKMGWEGSGLGKTEQGIQDPIKQGDIRDKQDMYKGIGIDLNDAFSQYRKNMSYSFNRPRRNRR